MLLRLESVHVNRQLRWRDHVRKEDEFPARELRAITQIQIFRQGVMLPTSRLFDAGAPPKPAVPLKLKKRPLRLRAVCSSKRWPSRNIACTRVSRE